MIFRKKTFLTPSVVCRHPSGKRSFSQSIGESVGRLAGRLRNRWTESLSLEPYGRTPSYVDLLAEIDAVLRNLNSQSNGPAFELIVEPSPAGVARSLHAHVSIYTHKYNVTRQFNKRPEQPHSCTAAHEDDLFIGLGNSLYLELSSFSISSWRNLRIALVVEREGVNCGERGPLSSLTLLPFFHHTHSPWSGGFE